MSDPDDVPESSSRPSTRVMGGTLSPKRRSTAAPRRVSSAPDLHTSQSLRSKSTSLNEPGSSLSLSDSSDPQRSCSHDLQEAGDPVAPAIDAGRACPAASVTDPPPTHESPQQLPLALQSTTHTLEEVHRVIQELQRRERRRGARGLWIALRALFGYGPDGSAARKEVMSLLGKMFFGAGQIGATVAMLCLAARTRSPTDNTINEWQACRRPLGVWCCIWCVRVISGCLMAFWGYRRKVTRSLEHTDRRTNEESADRVASPGLEDSNTRPAATHRRRSHPRRAEVEASWKVSALTFARLTTLLSLLSLTWFVTAHVLIYTSVHTCRMSAPHLWWLTFGIICIGYLIIVEVILVAFIVFIVGPLIFLFLNLILICMGRRPLHHPNHINPEVGKLPQKAVDLIPLVLYIPAPAPKDSAASNETPQDASASHTEKSSDAPVTPLAIPEAAHVHSYPPTERQNISPPPTVPVDSTSHRPRRRFTFRRIRLRRSAKADVEKGKEKPSGSSPGEQGQLYEDKWERGEYPFVKLEGNRAACAICLCDFEEPRRVRYSIDSKPAEDLDRAEKGICESPTKSQQEVGLRLIDVGEGAQPLRLLACAHVFHKSCLDPWLTEVSGRCPVCQRPVEIGDPTKPEGRRRQRSQRADGG